MQKRTEIVMHLSIVVLQCQRSTI